MIAGANEISSGAVGLTYLCAIIPSLVVKFTGPYWYVWPSISTKCLTCLGGNAYFTSRTELCKPSRPCILHMDLFLVTALRAATCNTEDLLAFRFHIISYRSRSCAIAILMSMSYCIVAFGRSLLPQVSFHSLPGWSQTLTCTQTYAYWANKSPELTPKTGLRSMRSKGWSHTVRYATSRNIKLLVKGHGLAVVRSCAGFPARGTRRGIKPSNGSILWQQNGHHFLELWHWLCRCSFSIIWARCFLKHRVLLWRGTLQCIAWILKFW